MVACKEGQSDALDLMVNNQSKALSIKVNAQHVNGMTLCDLAFKKWKEVLLLDTLEYELVL